MAIGVLVSLERYSPGGPDFRELAWEHIDFELRRWADATVVPW